jgi:hypothetical protein
MNKRGFDGRKLLDTARALIEKTRQDHPAAQDLKASGHRTAWVHSRGSARSPFSLSNLHLGACIRSPIKHCRNCGTAVVYRMPDDGDTRSVRSARLPHDSLREPAERGRHRAPSGRPRAAVQAQHRAAQGQVDAAGRLHGTAARPPCRARRARPRRKPAPGSRWSRLFSDAERGPGRPGAPVLPRPAAETTGSIPVLKPWRPGCSRSPRFPGTRLPFSTVRETLMCYFADRRAGRFQVHTIDID